MPCWTVLLVSLALIAHDQFSHSVMNETLSKNELVMPPTEQQPKHVIAPAALQPPRPTPPPLFPTDPKRPIIYLIQMEGNLPPPNMNGADILCITWKNRRDPCVFLPNSTWTSGRNYMWKMVTMMDKKYEYYVFMDEDIVVSNLTLWEETLFRYRPAVGVPGGIAQVHPGVDITVESRVLTCFDAAFNAFHYDLVHDSLVLPYIDLFDKFGWWTSQLYMIYLTQVFYDGEVMGFFRPTTTNGQHRYYPRGWNLSAANKFWEEFIVADRELRKSFVGYSWTAKGVAQPHVTKQRFQAPIDLLSEFASMENPYWSRIAKIRASPNGMPPLAEGEAITFSGEDMNKMFGHKTKEYK
jgi:hypothetical protein